MPDLPRIFGSKPHQKIYREQLVARLDTFEYLTWIATRQQVAIGRRRINLGATRACQWTRFDQLYPWHSILLCLATVLEFQQEFTRDHICANYGDRSETPDLLNFIRARRTILVLFVFAVALLLVSLPRFNRNDVGFVARFTCGGSDCSQSLRDAGWYVNYVKHFRGELAPEEPVEAPFAYRPLSPLLAAPLPFRPLTSLNVVNLIFSMATLGVLWQVFRKSRLGWSLSAVGLAIYVFSFPVFFYGTIGLVDPLLIFFMTVGVYFTVARRWTLLAVTLFLGVLTKESMIILVPGAVAYQFLSSKSLSQLALIGILMVAVSTVALVLGRLWTPAPDAFYQWNPSVDRILANLPRKETWYAAFLTTAVPGTLTLLVLVRLGISETRSLLVINSHLVLGTLGSVATFVYAILAASADGRFLWLSYPFIIPLMLLGAQRFFEIRPSEADEMIKP